MKFCDICGDSELQTLDMFTCPECGADICEVCYDDDLECCMECAVQYE